jgi:hypothetical protein
MHCDRMQTEGSLASQLACFPVETATDVIEVLLDASDPTHEISLERHSERERAGR